MAEWSKNRVDSGSINGGREFTTDDDLAVNELNAMVNNSFYAVDFAEAMADAPDISEIDGTGTPSVSLVDNGKFKRFKFSNLKGVKGDRGEKGEKGEKGEPGESDSLIKYVGTVFPARDTGLSEFWSQLVEEFGYHKRFFIVANGTYIYSSSSISGRLNNKLTGENFSLYDSQIKQIKLGSVLNMKAGTDSYFDSNPLILTDCFEICKLDFDSRAPFPSVHCSWAGFEISAYDVYGRVYIMNDDRGIKVYVI